MLNKTRIFPDMLLIFIGKRHFSYFLLFYITIALLASYSFHFCATKQPSIMPQRRKRDLLICKRPCRCPPDQFKLTKPNGLSFCVEECPISFHTFYSGITGRRCLKCNDDNCENCRSSVHYCRSCKRPFVKVNGKCLSSCPLPFLRHKEKCVDECPEDFKLNKRRRACTIACTTDWQTDGHCRCRNGKFMKRYTRKLLSSNPRCKGRSLERSRTCKRRRSCSPFGNRNRLREYKSNNSQSRLQLNEKLPTLSQNACRRCKGKRRRRFLPQPSFSSGSTT